MPLQGTFDVLDFTEILRLVGRQSLTGRLHLRSRSFSANLFFEEGSLVGADQSEHPAAAAAGDVRSRLEEICFEMLEADRGSFEFQIAKATALPNAMRLKVDTVLTRARKRLEEWRLLAERVPSLDIQPRLVADLDATEVTLDKERWRMLTVVDGRRNLRTIGRNLNLSDFDVCRILVDLLDAGVVELDGAAAVLAASGRDLVPTIPLPDGLAESVVPGEADDVDRVEVVKVTRAETVGGRPRPSVTKRRASGGDAESKSDDAAPIAGSDTAGTAAHTNGGSKPPTTKATTIGAGATDQQSDAQAPRRRARRRTPGGNGANAAGAERATGNGGSNGTGHEDAEATKRARRVVRIRSRLPKIDGTPET